MCRCIVLPVEVGSLWFWRFILQRGIDLERRRLRCGNRGIHDHADSGVHIHACSNACAKLLDAVTISQSWRF